MTPWFHLRRIDRAFGPILIARPVAWQGWAALAATALALVALSFACGQALYGRDYAGAALWLVPVLGVMLAMSWLTRRRGSYADPRADRLAAVFD